MLLELPEELQALEEPKFILMPPVVVQYGFYSIILALSLCGTAWLVHSLLGFGTVSHVQMFCGTLSMSGFAAALRSRNWRRSASFACDRNGIFLRRKSHPTYTFKPWSEVGGAYIGKAGKSKDVILKVRFSKDEWYEHIGHGLDYTVDKDGYVHCATGKQCRDVNNTLKSIARVWKLRATKSDFQPGLRPEKVVPSDKVATAFTALLVSVFFSFFLVSGFKVSLDQAKRALRNGALVASGVKANGTVIGYKTGQGRRGGSRYSPIVTFVTTDGKAVKFVSLHRPGYTGDVPGKGVPVLYDPHDPSIAEINERERLWDGVTLNLVLGTVFMIFGGGGIFAVIRNAISGGNRPS